MKTVWTITTKNGSIDAPEVERTASGRVVSINGKKYPVFWKTGKGYYIEYAGRVCEARNLHIEKMCGII